MFENRVDAGRRLAAMLAPRLDANALVLSLPRGGVVVGAAIAELCHLALDLYVVRKLRAPASPELAIGALAEDGPPFLDEVIIRRLDVSADYLEHEVKHQRVEIERQVMAFRKGRPLEGLGSREIVLVDDGIATGATVRAAILGLRDHDPSRLVVAAPVSSTGMAALLRREADEVVILETPEDFWAVGQCYLHFPQLYDQEVVAALSRERMAKPQP